jgi:class 3 adenylate cyclase
MADRLSVVVSHTVREALAHDSRVRFHSERQAKVRGFKEPIVVYDLARGTPA